MHLPSEQAFSLNVPNSENAKILGDSVGSCLPFVCSHSFTDTTKHHSHSFKRSCGFISAPQTHPAFCVAPDIPWCSPSLSALRHRQGAEMPYPSRGVSLHPATSYIRLSQHLFFFFFQEGTSDLSEGEWHYSRCDLESALTYKTANLWQTNTFLLTPC